MPHERQRRSMFDHNRSLPLERLVRVHNTYQSPFFSSIWPPWPFCFLTRFARLQQCASSLASIMFSSAKLPQLRSSFPSNFLTAEAFNNLHDSLRDISLYLGSWQIDCFVYLYLSDNEYENEKKKGEEYNNCNIKRYRFSRSFFCIFSEI